LIVEITTVEGVLSRVVRGLTQEQPLRKAIDPENAEKIGAFIERIQAKLDLSEPFSFVSAVTPISSASCIRLMSDFSVQYSSVP
jgi:zinc finger protein